MKLGHKIGGGFGTLILIMIGLGSFAMSRMARVGDVVTRLTGQAIPELSVLAQTDRTVRQSALAMRKYVYTNVDSDYGRRRKN